MAFLRFVMSFRRFVTAFRRFGTPILFVDSLFSEVDSAKCQKIKSSYLFRCKIVLKVLLREFSRNIYAGKTPSSCQVEQPPLTTI